MLSLPNNGGSCYRLKNLDYFGNWVILVIRSWSNVIIEFWMWRRGMG